MSSFMVSSPMAAVAFKLRRRSASLFYILRSPFSALAAHSESPASSAPVTIAALKSAIHSESDPDRVVELFQSASHISRFYAHRPLFSLAVRKLARAHRPDLVDRLLSHLLSDPKSPNSEGFIIRLIMLYSAAGMPDHAAAAFDRIPDILGRPRSDKSLSALLSAYLHNRRFDLVVDTFNRAEKDFGIVPDIVSHNILLQALCVKGDIETAHNMLDEMDKKGVKPDIVSFNTLLNGYLKKGDDRFQEIIEKISNEGLEPDVVTYNCQISKLCRDLETIKGEELLDLMVSKGIQPSLTTFATIIIGFCRQGDVNAAVKVFKRMTDIKNNGKEGATPKPDTYVVLIRGLVDEGDFSEALAICTECLTKRFAPPFDVVRGLIDGLLKDSRIDEAKDVVAKMKMTVRGDAVDVWNKLEGALFVDK